MAGTWLGLHLGRSLAHFDEVALHLIYCLLQHLFWILHRAHCMATSTSQLASNDSYALPSLNSPHKLKKMGHPSFVKLSHHYVPMIIQR